MTYMVNLNEDLDCYFNAIFYNGSGEWIRYGLGVTSQFSFI
jgi:hypothetical protein